MNGSISPEAMVAMALPGAGRLLEGSWVCVPAVAGHRRSRRIPIPQVFIAVEAPGVSGDWVSMGIDLNGDGMGLTLPPQIEPGTEVRLTFKLDPETVFRRLPAVVIHQRLGVGAVEFRSWPEEERSLLLSYLLQQ